MKIIMVDTDPERMIVLTGLLLQRGHELVAAFPTSEDVKRFLEEESDFTFDIAIVADLSGDGPAAAQLLSQAFPDSQIIGHGTGEAFGNSYLPEAPPGVIVYHLGVMANVVRLRQ